MKIYYRLFFFCLAIILVAAPLQAQDLLTKQSPLPCLNKKYTIVAHIVKTPTGILGLTEAEVLQAVAETNKDFEAICVSFEVCEFRVIENYQYNTLEREPEWDELRVLHHQENRINMYFVEEVTGESICGFASLAGIQMLNSGGILIIKEDCVNRGTISHEMGHYFGLRHTFEGSGTELVDGSNCEIEGDLICDTPADPFVEGDAMELYIDSENPCRFISTKRDENGQFYQPDVGNIMSYYPSSCTCGFTHGQYMHMAATCTGGEMW